MPASPREQRYLAFTSLRFRPAPEQQFALFLSPDEGGQAGRMQRLEAAFKGTRPQHPPGAHRPSNALEVFWSKILNLEQISDQLSRAFRDDHHVRLADPL
jgi:hypothetical protein